MLNLKTFPTTTHATLGAGAHRAGVEEWKAVLHFSTAETTRRSHIPEYVSISEAVLELEQAPAELGLAFPRAQRQLRLAKGQTLIEVGALIAPGRHSFTLVLPESGVPAGFRATLRLTLRKPFVRTEDEAYCIDAAMMGASQRHLLEDDRNAQRVGRFEAWVKTLPQDDRSAPVSDRIDLSGTWAAQAVAAQDLSPYATPWYDDTHWQQVSVPHRLEGGPLDRGELIWLRRRVAIPASWAGGPVWLRCSGIDDEPMVYVNGCLVGYHCGWHQSFQLELSQYLEPGRDNLIAIRMKIRRPHAIWHDGGITYTFVSDFAMTRYPSKSEPLGGIFGSVIELARLDHPGALLFEPRFHPLIEGSVRILFAVGPADGTLSAPDPQPGVVHWGARACLRYRPPSLDYRAVEAAGNSLDLRALASLSDPLVALHGQLQAGGEALIWAYIGVQPELGLAAAEGSEIPLADGTRLLLQASGPSAPGLQPVSAPCLHPGWRWLALPIRPTADGRFALACSLARQPEQRASLAAAASRAVTPAGLDALAQAWEDQVYGCCRPLALSATAGAALRSLKQSLTLVAKTVPGEIPGLLCDLIKYPIFWLRDAAFSIPGSLYAGGLARAGAVAAAGSMFGRATEQIDVSRLNPDGTWSGGQRASDAGPLAVYAIYRVWCLEGDDWLRSFYPTVQAYMRYMDEVERRFDNEPDGIIRASDGDWWDYRYKGAYEREGSSGFVAVIYLRALAVAAEMAEAVGDQAQAQIWRARAEQGRSRLCTPIAAGGLLLADEGYLADSVQTLSDQHPNGWNYPRDLEQVTVFTGFRSLPHFIGIADRVITAAPVIDRVIEMTDHADLIRPFPALTGYPWNDYMRADGAQGEFEASEFIGRWKALPGNHNAGGRWYFVGGVAIRGLWAAARSQAGRPRAAALAREAQDNLYRSMAIAHSPARVIEDAHASGLARHESGDPLDTQGFYYNWGAATPLEALVEGQYGVRSLPGGVCVDPWLCAIGDGIARVPIAGGEISYCRHSAQHIQLTVASDRPLAIAVPIPPGQSLSAISAAGSPLPLRVEDRSGGPVAVLAWSGAAASVVIQATIQDE